MQFEGQRLKILFQLGSLCQRRLALTGLPCKRVCVYVTARRRETPWKGKGRVGGEGGQIGRLKAGGELMLLSPLTVGYEDAEHSPIYPFTYGCPKTGNLLLYTVDDALRHGCTAHTNFRFYLLLPQPFCLKG